MSARHGVVAIVGRPNVGKSTLFNRLAGRRIAIVEETPGLTRDRIYAECEWRGKRFTIVDTGGLQMERAPLLRQVRRQAEFAIEEADAILFVVDGKEGLAPLDREVAEWLRRANKPVLLVVNKVESKGRMEESSEFYALGFGEPLPVSALHGIEVGELLDRLVEELPPSPPEEAEAATAIRVAIVGRPNVGKSSLVNAILGEERAIVDVEPGTTRDATDSPYGWDGHSIVLVDTAGIRRKSRVHVDFEYYSVLRAFGAIERSDVTVLLLDATAGVTDQDKRIAGHAHEEGRALVLAVNKWDLVDSRLGAAAEQQEGAERLPKQSRLLIQDFDREARGQLPFVSYAPLAVISALHHGGLKELLDTVVSVAEAHSFRVSTPLINKVIGEAMREPPSSSRGLKIYYVTQTGVRPPSFLLFVNSPKAVHFSQERYLENRLRERFPLEGTPLRLRFREATRKQKHEQ